MKLKLNWSIALLALAVTSQAHAYVGPGSGLSALASVLALIGGFFLLIVGFVWYPIKRLLRRVKNGKTQTSKDDGSQDSERSEPAEQDGAS